MLNDSITDKNVLVTGASRGIGASVVKALVACGANVFANIRDMSSLTEGYASWLSANQNRVTVLTYDVTASEEVKRHLQGFLKQQNGLWGLVNNAGVMSDAPMSMTSESKLADMWEVNGKAAFMHTQFAGRIMSRFSGGSIVNLCSVVGEYGSSGQSAYSMTKGALSSLTKSAAKELGPHNIRVNGVAPGFIETDMTSHYGDAQRQKLLEQVALNRFGSADEVAKVIVFLLSDSASYISGQVIAVDGVMSL